MITKLSEPNSSFYQIFPGCWLGAHIRLSLYTQPAVSLACLVNTRFAGLHSIFRTILIKWAKIQGLVFTSCILSKIVSVNIETKFVSQLEHLL